MPLNFNTNYVNNFPPNAQLAFQRALNTWSALLNSNIQIDVTAIWGANLPGFDAICIPNAIENFPNAPLANTWYPSSLADKLANQDLQANDEDMAIYFSGGANWNLGPGNPVAGQEDLESVALHELGHGLGFVGIFLAVAWPWVGSYGDPALLALLQAILLNNPPLPFALPALNFHPSVYGTHIEDLNGNYLTAPNIYANPSPQLGAELISDNLFFDLNPRVQVYAPNPFAPFTSVDHLSNPVSLMRPQIAAGQHVRVVDPPVLQILNALGW